MGFFPLGSFQSVRSNRSKAERTGARSRPAGGGATNGISFFPGANWGNGAMGQSISFQDVAERASPEAKHHALIQGPFDLLRSFEPCSGQSTGPKRFDHFGRPLSTAPWRCLVQLLAPGFCSKNKPGVPTGRELFQKAIGQLDASHHGRHIY